MSSKGKMKHPTSRLETEAIILSATDHGATGRMLLAEFIDAVEAREIPRMEVMEAIAEAFSLHLYGVRKLEDSLKLRYRRGRKRTSPSERELEVAAEVARQMEANRRSTGQGAYESAIKAVSKSTGVSERTVRKYYDNNKELILEAFRYNEQSRESTPRK